MTPAGLKPPSHLPYPRPPIEEIQPAQALFRRILEAPAALPSTAQQKAEPRQLQYGIASSI